MEPQGHPPAEGRATILVAAARDKGEERRLVEFLTHEGFQIATAADGEAALAFFHARGAAVNIRDVGRDPAASQELSTRLGRLGVPAIVIDGRVLVGFTVHRGEIEALLRD